MGFRSAPAEKPVPLSPQKEFFQKGYSITNLFSVLIILSMINENSLKGCLTFKPQDNFHFKYLLSFSYEFNLPFNLFKGFDLAAKWTLSFSLILEHGIAPLKFLQCDFPPFGFDLFISV